MSPTLRFADWLCVSISCSFPKVGETGDATVLGGGFEAVRSGSNGARILASVHERDADEAFPEIQCLVLEAE